MEKCVPWESSKEVPSDISDKREERGKWNNGLDFLFSCITLTVGLGNVWRFPYLCYENGGGNPAKSAFSFLGTFLVTYCISMVLCGIPIFYQEIVIGQYLGIGGSMFVGQLCPMLQGVGYATMIIVFFHNVYYCIIVAWALFYVINSVAWFPTPPWGNCDNWWNTDYCYIVDMEMLNYTNEFVTPEKEFWENRVLGKTDGITQMYSMRWELFTCLAVSWIIVYLIVCREIHQSEKILRFTALFPYILLLVLFVKGISLPGAGKGLLYYITPQWHKLLTAKPWIEGVTQIFFTYSIGTGALPTLGSYNNFNHNCYRDVIITCVVNTLTSLLAGCVTFAILGNLALHYNTTVDEVVNSGPGFVFLTYTKVVLQLKGGTTRAIIFFLMLFVLGIGSEFCLVKLFIRGMVDKWPKQLRRHKELFTFAVCFLLFLLGVPMVFKGGFYLFKLMDYHSSSGLSLIWVCFFETTAISWVFGADRVSECIEQMIGIRTSKFWYFCWVFFVPITMLGIFVFYIIEYVPLTTGGYSYPDWAQALGFTISLASMMWIPGYVIYYFAVVPGSFKQKFKAGCLPKVKIPHQ